MFPLLPVVSVATSTCHSLIDRVLHLRRQLGIDIPLSISGSEDASSSPGVVHASSSETLRHTLPACDSRDWLVWSQSPGGRNLPEKD